MIDISNKTLISQKVKKWTWPIFLLMGSYFVLSIFLYFFVDSVLTYEMSKIKNDQQILYSMFGNSYYKLLGLEEGTE